MEGSSLEAGLNQVLNNPAGAESESNDTQDTQEGIDTGVQTPPEIVPHETIPKSSPAGVQNNAGKAEAQGFDYEWWKKDQRFGKIWGKDKKSIPIPVDGVKSWHEADKILETKYKPAYKQYEDLKNRIKELGYDPEKTDDFLNEVKSWKDPDNPIVKLGNYVYQWKDDPLCGDIDKFFTDLNVRKMQRDFPNWTQEQISEFKNLQEEIKAMKAEKEAQRQAEMKQKDAEVVSRLRQDIDVEMKRIEEKCKTLGFEFTQEIRDKLYDYGVKESLNPKHLDYAFQDLFKDEIQKLSENKLKSKIMTERQAKLKNKVPYSSGNRTTQTVKKPFIDRFVDIVTPKK
jgi:hypothetical protein